VTQTRSQLQQAVLGVAHTRPAFPVPPGACDCHVHIFAPPDKYPFIPERTYMPDEARVRDLAGLQDALGLARVVIIQASPQGTDNRCLLGAIADLRAMGRQARGVAVIEPDASPNLLRELHEGGVRGLRVNLQSFGLNDPQSAAAQLRATAAQAASMGWHVQVYTNLAMVAALRETIAGLPMPLVVDHFGLANAAGGREQAGFDALLALAASGKVYVKLSAPYRITSRPDHSDGVAIVRPLIDANPERMLWGTDWPHTGAWPGVPRRVDTPEPFHPIDDGLQLNLLGAWASVEELRRILVDNPAKLYGF
jgi:predicted TIM-barrel fold metal-dependent hydrolase